MNAVTKIEVGQSVYAKIAAVQGELAKVGIAKNRRNTQGSGYNFRGIDDVYSALSPLLAQHGLVIIPRVTKREIVERSSKNGGALFYVTVHAEFDFISADDGSIHTAATFGEAMDSGDKATNKAMSAAYKYAAFMTFAIPTEGDNDADASTPEVASRGQEHSGTNREVSPAPEMPDSEWARLVQLVEASKADAKAMLDYFKVPNLRKLDQDQYAEAVEMLNAKLAKLAKADSDKSLADALDDKIEF
jgi:hypothetical protein